MGVPHPFTVLAGAFPTILKQGTNQAVRMPLQAGQGHESLRLWLGMRWGWGTPLSLYINDIYIYMHVLYIYDIYIYIQYMDESTGRYMCFFSLFFPFSEVQSHLTHVKHGDDFPAME